MGAWESGKADVDCGAALIQAVSFVAKGKGEVGEFQTQETDEKIWHPIQSTKSL